MRRGAGLLGLLFAVSTAACGDDGVEPVASRCDLRTVPFAGAADGPVVVDVGLDIQPGEGVVVVATATDPQGSVNIEGVVQSVRVYPDERCLGSPFVLLDDLAGSGLEETFGTAVDAETEAALFRAISGASSWPVHVDFQDLDGHRTRGDLRARVIR